MLNTQIQYWANVETKRHNMQYEDETKRHNLEQETQNWEDLRRKELEYWQTVKYQAEQIGVLHDQLKETIRHNKASEKIGSKQAQAAINSSIAAMRTASANLQNAYSNALNATSKRKEAGAAVKKAASEVRRNTAETSYKEKAAKYYVWTDVIPKYLNIANDVAKNVGSLPTGKLGKLGKVSAIKKGLAASLK